MVITTLNRILKEEQGRNVSEEHFNSHKYQGHSLKMSVRICTFIRKNMGGWMELKWNISSFTLTTHCETGHRGLRGGVLEGPVLGDLPLPGREQSFAL